MDQRNSSPASTRLLAILAAGAAFTWLGPVLRPLLVAVFVFYAIRSAAKWLARLGLGFTAASICLISLAVICAILLAQLVHRETGVFLAKWPRYEHRIEALLDGLQLPKEWRRAPEAGVQDASARAGGTVLQSGGRAAVPPAKQREPTGEQSGQVRERTADRQAADEEPDRAELDGGDPDDEAAADAEPTVLAVRRRSGTPAEPPSLLRDFVGGGAKAAVDSIFRRGLSVAELLLLVIVYTVFLSIGWRRFTVRILRAFPGERGRRLLAIGAGIGSSMEKFMAVKTLVGAGMAITAAAIMAYFRVDHWLLWTCLFFLANFVTSIGSIAACVPPIVVAFLGLASPATAAVVSTLLIVNRCVWIDFIEVRMAGRELSLDPVIVFVWLTYWGWAWGVIGLLLAYPMLAAVKIVLSNVQGYEGWATLLGDD